MLTLHLYGRFRLLNEQGEDFTPKSAKSQALVALLATSDTQSRGRLWLQKKLWPDVDRERWSVSLRQSLSEIRRALGPHRDVLEADRRSVTLDAEGVTLAPQMEGQEFLEGIGLDAGAHGVSLKTSPLDTLVDGIGAVLKGENWIGADAAQILEAGESQGQLTSREAQILNMIAQGMTNAEIGKRLGISPMTVDNHRTRLMGKLGVNSRAQLLAVALKTGLLGLHLQL